MNRAILYVRVSTEEQAQYGVSIEAQIERLTAYCQMSGLTVVDIIRDEGISGARPLATRPGGRRMLQLLEEGKVRHVVSFKLDRLFRDAEDALRQTREWDRSGVYLHLVDMGGQTLNTASAMGRFFLSMLASLAELERNLISERTKIALDHKKSHRQPYAPTPFGYHRVQDTLIENENEQGILRKIWNWRKAGESLHAIARKLNESGIPTKNKKKWYAGTVKYLLGNSLYSTL